MTIENLQKAIERTAAQLVEAGKELTSAKTKYTEAARQFATSGGNDGRVESEAQSVRRQQARVDGLGAEVESLKGQLSEAKEAERKAGEEEARREYNAEFSAIARRLEHETGLAIDLFRRLCLSLALVENLAHQTDTYCRYTMEGARTATRARQRLMGIYESKEFLAESLQREEGLRAPRSASLAVIARPLEMPAPGKEKNAKPEVLVAQPIKILR